MPKTNTKTKKTVTPKKKPSQAKPTSSAKPAQRKGALKPISKEKPKMPKKGVKAVEEAQKPKAGKASFKKEIKQKLIEAKAKILAEVSQKVRSESNVLKFEIGDIYDIASSERERELTLMLGDRERAKLAEIEEALERIDDSSYGECEECGEPIEEGRLRILPFTRVCVECQSRNEREQKIRGRVEEETGLGVMEKPEAEEEEF